jgi:transposase
MKGVDTIARIRREFFVRGRPIKEIVRDLHVSRNTVRKVVRSGATAFEYEREVQPLPKLGPWRDRLEALLVSNESKPARERLTLIRVFEELRRLGYEGGYDAVRRYARVWARQRRGVTADAYVPLSFAPGEAYQFDWSHEVVLINGVTVMVKVAHVRLCHSRMLFARAYPRESQEPPRSPDRGPSGIGLDRLADDQGCSTPTTGRSRSSRAPARAASTTT